MRKAPKRIAVVTLPGTPKATSWDQGAAQGRMVCCAWGYNALDRAFAKAFLIG